MQSTNLFQIEDFENEKFITVFKEIIPRNLCSDLGKTISAVATLYGVSSEDFVKENMNHPEWPSINQIIKSREEHLKKKD